MSCRRSESCVELQPLADRGGDRHPAGRIAASAAQPIGLVLARDQRARSVALPAYSGQPVIERAGLEHGVERVGGAGAAERAQQFLGDPLARQAAAASRRCAGRRRSPAPSNGGRPYQAWKRKKRSTRRRSSAMRWSGSPMKRTPAGREIGAAVERIVERAVGIGVERVEGEVAPARRPPASRR